MRTISKHWVLKGAGAVLCAALLAWLVAANSGRGASSPAAALPDAPKVIYESSRGIYQMACQIGSGQRFFLLAECADERAHDAMPRSRLLRLDLATGRTEVLARSAPGPKSDMPIYSYAPDGRVAAQEVTSSGPNGLVTAITTLEPGRPWRRIRKPDDRTCCMYPQWSPDGKALLYYRLRYAKPGDLIGDAIMVATVPPGGGEISETELAKDPSLKESVAWSADGGMVYHQTVVGSEFQLISIEWPSRTQAVVFRSFSMHLAGVAEGTGEVVWLSWSPDQPTVFSVWRMAPGRKPEATRASLTHAVREAKVSPDGRHLAVVPAEGGVVVYDLSDGSKRSIPALSGKVPLGLHWALGGGALVALQGEAENSPWWTNLHVSAAVLLVPLEDSG